MYQFNLLTTLLRFLFLRVLLCASVLFLSSVVFASGQVSQVPMLLKGKPSVVAEIELGAHGDIRERLTLISDDQVGQLTSELGKINQSIRDLRRAEEESAQLRQSYFGTFLSTFLALCSAIAVFYWQERYKIYRQNLSVANKWTVACLEMISSLARYKRVYVQTVNSSADPIRRLLQIPQIHGELSEYRFEVSELIFLVDKEQDKNHWDKLSRIHAIFDNFRLVKNLWQRHSTNWEEIRECALRRNGTVDAGIIDLKFLESILPPEKIVSHVLVCELAMKLTDDLLLECSEFITNFPPLVSRRLKRKKYFKLGKLLYVKLHSRYKVMLEPILPPDLASIQAYGGLSKEFVEARLTTVYPYVP